MSKLMELVEEYGSAMNLYGFNGHPNDESDADRALSEIRAAVQELERDAARLDSGCIITHERDEFGDEYKCERRGLDLRAMIDAAMEADNVPER